MTLQYRELLPEEFPLAPREVPGSEIYTPENSRILAAITPDGQVVATWTMFLCLHIEPFWIREDHRKSMTIMRRMTEHMKGLLRESGFEEVYTVVLEKTPVLARFASFFGARPVDGILYKWKDDSHKGG
jgi:hypothetical protein